MSDHPTPDELRARLEHWERHIGVPVGFAALLDEAITALEAVERERDEARAEADRVRAERDYWKSERESALSKLDESFGEVLVLRAALRAARNTLLTMPGDTAGAIDIIDRALDGGA